MSEEIKESPDASGAAGSGASGTGAGAPASGDATRAAAAAAAGVVPDDLDLDDDSAEDEEPVKKRLSFRWSSLSYASRVTLSFALIAAMTALVAIGVVSYVWEQHFQTYTQENMRTIAETTANEIATRYETSGSFTPYAIQPASNAVVVTKGVGMQVVDASNEILFDSTTQIKQSVATAADSSGGSPAASAGPSSEAKADDESVVPSIAPMPSQDNIARAPIIVNDQAVGSVRVWVYGSDNLLRATDQEFRDRSYEAMVFAAIIAIVLASIFGYFFARNLVKPIKRLTDTAEQLTEGNFAARANLKGEDELAQFGHTFDSMAAAVERDRELERRLTTDVAHELRTPLMAIQATVEAMVDGVLPVDEERLITVDSEVQRLSRLVDSLLKLSRLENRSNPNKQEVVNVGEVVSGIVATHEAYVHEAGLTLKYKADPDVIVLGDPDLIRQATANLISNAVRYTDEGGVISVRVKRGEAMASIAVKDTGIGLSPEEARMVFQRFWRADSGRDRESGGLGVGLTVVKEIVERHDGWVQVEGRKGEGACFTIHIPLYNERDKQRDKRRTNGYKSRSRR